jgi:branched-chain amino acid transport system permease protein
VKTASNSGLGFPLATAILIAVAIALPFAGVYTPFLSRGLVFALFACAFNLLLGFGGLMSFGHAMFFGIGAYVTAHAAKVWGVTPEAAIVIGMGAALCLGLVVSAVAIRKRGISFAMITLALAQMLYFVWLQVPFTHGEDGIQSVPRGLLFGIFNLDEQRTLYFFILACFALTYCAIYRFVRSPFGMALEALRDNEARAKSLGYDPDVYKFFVLMASAVIAGLAGSLKVFISQSASLPDVHWSLSGTVIVMAMLGGLGTFLGPVVGAFIIVALEEYAGAGRWVTVMTGAILLFCAVGFRQGLVPAVASATRWLGSRVSRDPPSNQRGAASDGVATPHGTPRS